MLVFIQFVYTLLFLIITLCRPSKNIGFVSVIVLLLRQHDVHVTVDSYPLFIVFLYNLCSTMLKFYVHYIWTHDVYMLGIIC